MNLELKLEETMMRNRILQCMSVATLGFMAACVAVNAADDKKPAGKDGFVSIFDGETLDGWEVSSRKGEKAWTVENGYIAGDADKGGRGYLVYAKDIKKNDWNTVHIIAKGNKFQLFINGKLSSEFTENLPEERRLKKGMMQFQLHDLGMIVHFKDVQLKILK